MLLPRYCYAQWERQGISSAAQFFNEVFFIDNNTGWITQFNATVLRTVDGGNTWLTSTLPSGGNSANRDICFVDASTGFISGSDGIWKTADGGATWTNITPPGVTGGLASNSCWFIDASIGVMGAGSCGDTTVAFYATADGGSTWSSVTYDHAITDVAVGGITYSGGTFYAAGGSGKIWWSTDNGITWSSGNTGSAGWQEDIVSSAGSLYIASSDGTSCGATGGGKILVSANGGATWTTTAYAGTIMWGVSMYNATDGWAGGDFGKAYKTTNSGLTWSDLSCGLSINDRVDDINFTDATHGWAVGDAVYKYVGDYFIGGPDTIDFGDVVIGRQSADSTAVVQALGTGGTVSLRVIAGLNSSEFGATGNLGASQTLTACGTGLTMVHFTPTTVGPKIAQLEFTVTDFPFSPIVVYLKGNGVKPAINGPTEAQLDTLTCEQEGFDRITITSNGDFPLTIDSVRFADLTSGTLVLASPALPVTLLPGQSRELVVNSVSPDQGAFSGTMNVYSDDPDNAPLSIELNGYRRKIRYSFDLDTLITIPPARLDATSRICLKYKNDGDGIQIIESVTSSSSEPSISHQPSVSRQPVTAGQTHELCFEATAADTLWHTRRYKIQTMPCGLDTFITVRYRAINPVARAVKERSIVLQCDSSVTGTIYIANTGSDTLVLSTPSLTGIYSTSFTVIEPSSWPVRIPVGDSVKVVIRFAPIPIPGNHTATLIVPTNDLLPGNNPTRIDLTGLQQASSLAISDNRIIIDTLCVNQTGSGMLQLENVGSVPGVIIGLTPLDGTIPVSPARNPAGSTVLPGRRDSIQFTAAPITPGKFTARYLFDYGSCDGPDTVTVIGYARGVDLGSTIPALAYGSIATGIETQKTITLTNNGNVPATVTALSLIPPLPQFRIVNPAPPFVIQPGGSRVITIGCTPGEAGELAVALQAIAEEECVDTLNLAVTANGVEGALFASKNDIDFGVFLCQDSETLDSITITNTTLLPIDITGLTLMNGLMPPFTILTQLQLPYPIPPGQSVTVHVSFNPTSPAGVITDQLVMAFDNQQQPEITIPLKGRIDRAALVVENIGGSPVLELEFPTLNKCTDLSEAYIRLRNTGTVHDTITVTSSAAEFVPDVSGTIILPPGADSLVRIRAALTLPGIATGMIQIRSMPCDITMDVQATADYQRVQAMMGDITFVSVPLHSPQQSGESVRNTGTASLVVGSIIIDPPASDFTLVGNYTGATIPPNGNLPVTVEFDPQAVGAASAVLKVILAEPCIDTIIVSLTGLAVVEERYTLGLRAGSARGRWGTTVRVPVGTRNVRNAPLNDVEILATAAPTLLNPVGAVVAEPYRANGWQATLVGYNPQTGTARVRLYGGGNASFITTADTLFWIEYEVLRGDLITTGIALDAQMLPQNVTADTTGGDFALEDYCDAYGRLLRITGDVVLKQNSPNPFADEAVIEFETAFAGHVTLTIYDATGREVLRPVDETMPAGRRQVRISAETLGSGTYTYRLLTGLQALVQRMVVER